MKSSLASEFFFVCSPYQTKRGWKGFPVYENANHTYDWLDFLDAYEDELNIEILHPSKKAPTDSSRTAFGMYFDAANHQLQISTNQLSYFSVKGNKLFLPQRAYEKYIYLEINQKIYEYKQFEHESLKILQKYMKDIPLFECTGKAQRPPKEVITVQQSTVDKAGRPNSWFNPLIGLIDIQKFLSVDEDKVEWQATFVEHLLDHKNLQWLAPVFSNDTKLEAMQNLWLELSGGNNIFTELFWGAKYQPAAIDFTKGFARDMVLNEAQAEQPLWLIFMSLDSLGGCFYYQNARAIWQWYNTPPFEKVEVSELNSKLKEKIATFWLDDQSVGRKIFWGSINIELAKQEDDPALKLLNPAKSKHSSQIIELRRIAREQASKQTCIDFLNDKTKELSTYIPQEVLQFFSNVIQKLSSEDKEYFDNIYLQHLDEDGGTLEFDIGSFFERLAAGFVIPHSAMFIELPNIEEYALWASQKTSVIDVIEFPKDGERRFVRQLLSSNVQEGSAATSPIYRIKYERNWQLNNWYPSLFKTAHTIQLDISSEVFVLGKSLLSSDQTHTGVARIGEVQRPIWDNSDFTI